MNTTTPAAKLDTTSAPRYHGSVRITFASVEVAAQWNSGARALANVIADAQEAGTRAA